MLDIKAGPRKPTACICCDGECLEQVSEGSGFGPMLDSAQQIEFILSDGSLCDITFCNHCAKELKPAYYHHVWRRCIDSWEEEIDELWRRNRGLKPWTEEEKDKYRRKFYPKWIVGRLWSRRPKSFTHVEIVR